MSFPGEKTIFLHGLIEDVRPSWKIMSCEWEVKIFPPSINKSECDFSGENFDSGRLLGDFFEFGSVGTLELMSNELIFYLFLQGWVTPQSCFGGWLAAGSALICQQG